ncbi:hypothetical protein NMG60_11017045 [Bertholletia excelsa]
MRCRCARTIFLFSSRSVPVNPINSAELYPQGLRIYNFSTASKPYYSRRQEDESRKVRVAVWWDFENCHLPAGANVFKVAQSITAAVRASGIRGPIQITAFGDVLQLSRFNQEALSTTGINLTHIPNGGKNSADRSLLVDLMCWVAQNPPPAHLFLISGDKDFAGILHRLRMSNYNILLASPDTAPNVLCSAASIMWNWNVLVRGENLTGKHFNQPPDGPYGSWYGNSMLPLEDPFAAEQPASSQTGEVSDSNSEPKLRIVPKSVVKQIRNILNSYPNGISVSDFRVELFKNNVCIDRDFYGYKKFSRFLLSMPHIVKLQSGADGQFFIKSVAPKTPGPVAPAAGKATGSVTSGEEPGSAIASNLVGESSSTAKTVNVKSSMPPSTDLNVKEPPVIAPNLVGENSSAARTVDMKSSMPASPDLNVKDPLKKVQNSQIKSQELSSLAENENNIEATEKSLSSVEECNSASEVGFLKRMWRKWFSVKSDCPEMENSSSLTSSGNKKTPEKYEKSTCQKTDPVAEASFPSSTNKATMDEKVAGGDEAYGDRCRDNGFFNQIMSWCRFWRKRPISESSSANSSEKINQGPISSGQHQLFFKESFWDEMEAFINKPTSGSFLVLQSRSREHMAENLQKHGPSVVRSLSQGDILQLVDLLISEKKWVRECSLQAYPFTRSQPAGKGSSSNNPLNSNGLSAIFLNTTSPSSSKTLSGHDGERRHQNISRNGLSRAILNKRSSGKSRDEILADCQILVDHIVKEYPEGFNMDCFMKLFFEKYGYHLDIQKLGFGNLVTMLQIMPGARIESTYILPCDSVAKSSGLEAALPDVQESITKGEISNLVSEPSDVSRKYDESDSQWEELGPVAQAGSKRNGTDLVFKRRVKEESPQQVSDDYEMLSDDYISDSEEEASLLTGSEGQGKPRIDVENSTLLQILDSWYSTKDEIDKREVSESEEGTNKEVSDGVKGMVCGSGDALKPSSSANTGFKTETSVIRSRQKKRSCKSFSFVSEQPGDNKEQLIDGILGSLKKSGEARI